MPFHGGLFKALSWALLRLTWNPSFPINRPEFPPYQSQHRQLEFKRKFSVTITDCNKKHWLSLFLSLYLGIYDSRFSNFQGKMSSLLIQIFFFIFCTPHFMWLYLYKLTTSLLALIPQCLRPDLLRQTFPAVNAVVIAPSLVKNRPCTAASILKE